MQITQEQLNRWYEGKSNKERYLEANEQLEADREEWLKNLGKDESDVLSDGWEEYVLVTQNKVKLPEEIQTKNIEA